VGFRSIAGARHWPSLPGLSPSGRYPITTAALVPIQPAFTDSERLALAGFLAGYRDLTREAYALDLRQFTSWCRTRSLALFAVRRADIEGFARQLEARGRARATVTRRLSTIVGFYKYAVEEELLDHSPAAHVRRPRVDYESHAIALDRNELGALHAAARVYHRRAGCRGLVARRAGSRLPCGPEDHDAIRPGPWQPGPARDLYCRRLRRRRRPIASADGQQVRLAALHRQADSSKAADVLPLRR
jgi:hypothetical protein